MTPDEYCQERAAASGSSFYYSFLFLPLERRRAIMALYAFCREIDDVVDECADHSVAAAKQLLSAARGDGRARHINWARVDALSPYGGIRVEDDLAITAEGSENLTRDAFRALT